MVHPVPSLQSALIILLTISPLIVFWLLMFRDMLNRNNLPNLMTSDSKSDWTFAFIFLNVFAAVLYYSTVYRNRR
jgi:hypothetical protein